MRRRSGWWVAAALALAAGSVGAQERPVEEMDLPRGVADEIIDFFNRPTTFRFQGRAEIPEGRVVQGDVAVLGGPLLLGGEIRGDLVVVNGQLTISPGGRVTGDVIVVGGDIQADPDAVGGQLSIYGEALTYRRRGDAIAYDERPWAGWGERRRRGRSYFSIRNEGNYNRVEGLPVMFGPVFRTEGENFFRGEVMGVWRSESGIRLAPREWGYLARAEQHFGPGGRFSAGGTVHSLVAPVEGGGLTNIEASLATFLLHRDHRDYFDREGFSAYVRYDDADTGLRLTAEYRDEEHTFAPVRSPWTIQKNDGPWRPQPLVAEGRLRSLGGHLRVDARNDRSDPSDGWYLDATAVTGVGGSLVLPSYRSDAPVGIIPSPGVVAARQVETDFVAGTIDVRRYARLGPGADLRLRGFLGGSADGSPLPPQFQRALGGEGSLPGYRPLFLDCGARSNEYTVFRRVDGDTEEPMATFGGYGCDRVALFQAEYRGDLSFNLDFGGNNDWDEGWGWYPTATFSPTWSVFFDAGRGWTLSEQGTPGYLGPDSETLMDIGLGLSLGDLGFYWAWALNGPDRDVNFFIRFDHRF